MKNITQAELISIGKIVFGTKKVSSDMKRNLPGGNVPAHLSGETFSVSNLKQLEKITEENRYIIYRKCKSKISRDFWVAVDEITNIDPVKQQLEKLERINKPIKYSDELNVEKAKQFPISNLLKIKGNRAICPFHKDSNPSLVYYPKTNSCYCFSCNKGGDVIDVYKALNNCSFKEAVLKLQ